MSDTTQNVLKIGDNVRFGDKDLLLGPSAAGELGKLQAARGGLLLADFYYSPGLYSFKEFAIETIRWAKRKGRGVHVDVTHMQDLTNVFRQAGRFANTYTALEMTYIRRHFLEFDRGPRPKFYRNDRGSLIEVPCPWLTPDTCEHPGTILLREWIKSSPLTITRAAIILRIPRSTLSSLVNTRRRLSRKTADAVCNIFGGSVADWLTLQVRFDRRASEALRREVRPETRNRKLRHTLERMGETSRR